MSVIQGTFLLCILYQLLGETTPNKYATPHQLIAQASNGFTLKMYNAVKDEGGNIFISPLSLGILLAMLHHGANGAVANEIQRALQLPNDECVKIVGFKDLIGRLERSDPLVIATKMFAAANFRIKKKFLSDAQNYFYSGIDSLDFHNKPDEAVTTINSFVAEKTHNKITKLFDDRLPTDTMLVLVNALYFKAAWEHSFGLRRQQKFYITNDYTVDVDMIHITEYLNYKHESYLKAQLVEIPYEGGEYSMIIILPDEKDGLSRCENKIASMNFEKVTNGMTEYEVSLTMPKFKMEKKYELNSTLKKMGMTTMFHGAANFSGITNANNVYVSEAVQKTYINVDENGTVAAAVTGITAVFKEDMVILNVRKKVVRADHPFIFAIVQKSENFIVFLGRLVSVRQLTPKSSQRNY